MPHGLKERQFLNKQFRDCRVSNVNRISEKIKQQRKFVVLYPIYFLSDDSILVNLIPEQNSGTYSTYIKFRGFCGDYGNWVGKKTFLFSLPILKLKF